MLYLTKIYIYIESPFFRCIKAFDPLLQKSCLTTSKTRNRISKILAEYVRINGYVYKIILVIDSVHL